ncbi:hypothetical protein ACIRD2_25790 [Streptomyces sp. NPDC093595]|uniref:hypothetical protein n=1 Tax=Streptomyces sp. NPDC093595 TaxID=3366045 RepID=UPI003802342B
MRLTLTRYRPRTGPHEHRIVVPRPPLRHTTLSDPLEGWGYLVGDHDGLSRLAALFAFAAFSRHTVVHVPLRRSLPRPYAPGVPVDLVLAHHSLGLRPSAWRERCGHRDAPDRLRPAVHAHTLFLFGSRDVFAAACGELEHAAGFGPHHPRAAEGLDTLVASLTPLLAPDGSRSPAELDIGFRARPPHRHFRPPGRPPASRRPPPAASP